MHRVLFIVKQQTIILLILAGLGLQLRNNLLIEELLFFRGIVAVGTQEGHIYLLDILQYDSVFKPRELFNPEHLQNKFAWKVRKNIERKLEFS